jgi:3-hydroxyacyl-CoA dehydrogenase
VAESVLGKGVVLCKDTPNFIANRMLSYILSDTVAFAAEHGYRIEEIESLAGPLLGRPRSGVFRLYDIIGIDTMAMIDRNLFEQIAGDPDRAVLQAPAKEAIIQTLLDQQLLGAKSGQGFYKTETGSDGSKRFWSLDLTAAAQGQVRYLPPVQPSWESVTAIARQPLPARLRALTQADDTAGAFVWHTLSHTLAYAALRIPEIADRLEDIDNALRWGFGWEMGPFEIWDALGVAETASRMQAAGLTLAPWVTEMLGAGYSHFYTEAEEVAQVYDPAERGYRALELPGQPLTSSSLLRRSQQIAANDSARLLDTGDGVLLLEFRSRANALDSGVLELLQAALTQLQDGATGLIIGNQGAYFSAGANLKNMLAQAERNDWQALEHFIRQGQATLLAIRTAAAPVVVAPFLHTVAGGAELTMAAHRVTAQAETYMGLVESNVGLVPGWGGCKELVRRIITPAAKNDHPQPALRRAFELVRTAAVSGSALEAKEMGFLEAEDLVIMNREQLLAAAKAALLASRDFYRPATVEANLYAAGAGAYGELLSTLEELRAAATITAHDAHIGSKLARILSGGELSVASWVDEQHFLDLEREAFLSLIGEEATQARMRHMLERGKPLRN